MIDHFPFQSTRPRGARRCTLSAARLLRCFNPRAREGRDAGDIYTYGDRNYVSIHAPARGATVVRPTSEPGRLVSIHAPARGATTTAGVAVANSRVSIHAPARGATTAPAPADPGAACFNPRAREGRDNGAVSVQNPIAVSIHAPARGATELVLGRVQNIGVSIHAPARGATRPSSDLCAIRCCFNPRAREGRDHSSRHNSAHNLSFNPRAREGRDRPWPVKSMRKPLKVATHST